MKKILGSIILIAVSGTAILIMKSKNQIDSINFIPEPLYDKTESYSTNIPNRHGTGDETDIYYPLTSESNKDSFPVALFLQGLKVDKSNYSNFANIVASYGFIVIVPNHFQDIPQFKKPVLMPETSQIENVLSFVEKENLKIDSPIRGKLDLEKFTLLGHSAGGSVGLTVVDGDCTPVFCNSEFDRPSELLGGAFFGTSRINFLTKEFLLNKNDRIPVALLQGSKDGVVLNERTRKTYDLIKDPPKVLVTIFGTNHFGITNTDNLERRENIPELEQKVATETIARWSALFLRGVALNDKKVKDYIFEMGGKKDINIELISEQE